MSKEGYANFFLAALIVGILSGFFGGYKPSKTKNTYAYWREVPFFPIFLIGLIMKRCRG